MNQKIQKLPNAKQNKTDDLIESKEMRQARARLKQVEKIAEQLHGTSEDTPPSYVINPESGKLGIHGDVALHILKQLKMAGTGSLSFAELITSQLIGACSRGEKLNLGDVNG